jgi:hypothetical protein
MGVERRRAERGEGSLGNMSFRVAVLARDGRGGGEVMPFDLVRDVERFEE